jgi:cysteinyl-tRNA synthetase
LKKDFHAGLDARDPARMVPALLELDSTIWKASHDLESEEFISQAREILREWIVLLGARLSEVPKDTGDCLAPIVEEMLDLRSRFRRDRQWAEADAIRESLQRANVLVEDTPEGSRWRVETVQADSSPLSISRGAA